VNRVGCKFLGRWGNQLFQYCFARGYAEAHGCEFECGPWVGQQVFDLHDRPLNDNMPMVSEGAIVDGLTNITFYCYAQQQRAIDFYSKKKVQSWLVLRTELLDVFEGCGSLVACHLRRGDYHGAGYPTISRASYIKAVMESGLDPDMISWIGEDEGEWPRVFPTEISFVYDWLRMAWSGWLFRANSSFSWWSSAWGRAMTFSPVIDGLCGGKEHDGVKFVVGNHPKIADLPFITDLKLK
jgi:hypothetical protein